MKAFRYLYISFSYKYIVWYDSGEKCVACTTHGVQMMTLYDWGPNSLLSRETVNMINASFVILSHFPDLEQNLRQKLYPVAKGKGQNLLEQN